MSEMVFISGRCDLHISATRAVHKEVESMRRYLRTDFEEVLQLCAAAKVRYKPSFHDISNLEKTISLLADAYTFESQGDMLMASVAFSATANFIKSSGEAEHGNNMQFVRQIDESAAACLEKFHSATSSTELSSLMRAMDIARDLTKPGE